jgi:hypothetical protein
MKAFFNGISKMGNTVSNLARVMPSHANRALGKFADGARKIGHFAATGRKIGQIVDHHSGGALRNNNLYNKVDQALSKIHSGAPAAAAAAEEVSSLIR